jgi:hypothetical protein
MVVLVMCKLISSGSEGFSLGRIAKARSRTFRPAALDPLWKICSAFHLDRTIRGRISIVEIREQVLNELFVALV